MWKDKTCETCIFRVGEGCRKLPPQDSLNLINGIAYYPRVRRLEGLNNEWKYQHACSYHKE